MAARGKLPVEGGPKTARMQLAKNAEDFFLTHDQQLFAVNLDLGAGVLAKQNAVSGLDVQREDFAFVVRLALAYGDDFAFLRLVLRGVRNDNAALGRLRLGDALDDDTVVQGGQLRSSCHLLKAPLGLLVPLVAALTAGGTLWPSHTFRGVLAL